MDASEARDPLTRPPPLVLVLTPSQLFGRDAIYGGTKESERERLLAAFRISSRVNTIFLSRVRGCFVAGMYVVQRAASKPSSSPGYVGQSVRG